MGALYSTRFASIAPVGVATVASSTSSLSSRLLGGSSILECAHVNSASIPSLALGKPVGVSLENVCLQIDFIRKDDKLFLQTFGVLTHEMPILEVLLQCIVINVVLRILSMGPLIADKTSFVMLSAVIKELVVRVEALLAESTFRVSLKSALVLRSRYIISFPLMPMQFCFCEQGVLMGENFFMPGAKIAGNRLTCRIIVHDMIYSPQHHLMLLPYMAMQVRPSTTGPVA